MHLHHFFIATSDIAPLQAKLDSAGLKDGAGRVHPGQGTQNIRYFFDNAYLELLFAHDESELGSAAVKPTGLNERIAWTKTGACPFGFGLKPNFLSEMDLDLPTWEYHAPFLPNGEFIPVIGTPFQYRDPFVFILPEKMYQPKINTTIAEQNSMDLDQIEMYMTDPDSISESVRKALEAIPVTLSKSENYGMKLDFERDSTPLSIELHL
jgi:hypothetical protein